MDKSNSATSMWNYLMKKMSCCGVNNYTDFSISEKFKESSQKVPVACCKMNETSPSVHPLDPDCPRNPKPENSYYLTGCYKTMTDLMLGHMNFVIYAVAGVVLMELLATFLAFCMCNGIETYDK
ncbi:hypothetical protein AAG570_006133 [Ranatra chinensis]|uniref:Tetraspanin n=1 Tax=Ranatra chinensis TaxID=642074 RepID=A0ABD0YC63_9HEMI